MHRAHACLLASTRYALRNLHRFQFPRCRSAYRVSLILVATTVHSPLPFTAIIPLFMRTPAPRNALLTFPAPHKLRLRLTTETKLAGK